MQPSEYIKRLGELIRDGRDEEALDFAARVGPKVGSKLGADELFLVSGMMETAEHAARLARARETPSV